MFYVFCVIFCSVAVSSNAAEDKTQMEYVLGEINVLKEKQSSCDAKVSDLEAVVSNLQRRNDNLEQEISVLMQDSTRKGTVQSYGNETNQTNYEASLRKRRMVSSGQIAFTVGVSAADLTNLGDHQTIVFDRAVSNIGNAYNTKSGIFQAPLKGAYVFTLTMMVVPRHSEYLEIVVDGNNINDILADASSVDDNMSTTKQWILELNSGSQVWIWTSSYNNHGEIHGNSHTLFSGFLLFEME